MTENYYKEFYSSEFINSRLGDSLSESFSPDSDEEDFIIAGQSVQNVSYQDSNCST